MGAMSCWSVVAGEVGYGICAHVSLFPHRKRIVRQVLAEQDSEMEPRRL